MDLGTAIADVARRHPRRLLTLTMLFLLFVTPAHATLQAIVCEHLPSGYGELHEGPKKHGGILRSGDRIALLLDRAADGDDILLPELIAFPAIAARPVLSLAGPALKDIVSDRHDQIRKRAPPAAS